MLPVVQSPHTTPKSLVTGLRVLEGTLQVLQTYEEKKTFTFTTTAKHRLS